MLNYKIEVDEYTNQISVHWYNEEGEEVTPPYGTYRVVIPANTFVWHGDNVSCQGKQGNDEFVYTIVVAEPAPKPEITPIIKDSVCYYVVTNSSNSHNYKQLGYKTAGGPDQKNVKISPSVGAEALHNVQWMTDVDCSFLGLKGQVLSLFYVNFNQSYEGYKPDTEYTVELLANSIYNVGTGDKYSTLPTFNESSLKSYCSVKRPSVSTEDISYNYETHKLTVKYKPQNTVYTDEEYEREHFDTNLLNQYKPVCYNQKHTATAYTESVVWDDNDPEHIVVTINLHDEEDFIITDAATGAKYVYCNIHTLEKWLSNNGDGENKIGIEYSLGFSMAVKFLKLESVPSPNVLKDSKSQNDLKLTWTNVNGDHYTTEYKKGVRFTAVHKSGTEDIISNYLTVKNPTAGNPVMDISIDTEGNFGIDIEQIDHYEILVDDASVVNTGDNFVFSGTAANTSRLYQYSPVDCKPAANLLKTNVNPFFPLVQGTLLSPVHESESTVIGDGAITVSDEDDNLLMYWKKEMNLSQIEDAESRATEDKINEDTKSSLESLYSSGDNGLYDASDMYSVDGAYEQYHGNVITMRVSPNSMVVNGDGISRLGRLSGTTDTPSITRYVAEVEFAYLPTISDDYYKIVGNEWGGLMDWNEDEFGKYLSADQVKPYVLGAYGYGGSQEPYGIYNKFEKLKYLYSPYSGYQQNMFETAYTIASKMLICDRYEKAQSSFSGEIEYYKSNYQGFEIAYDWFKTWDADNKVEYTGDTSESGATYWDYSKYTQNYSSYTEDKKSEALASWKDWYESKFINNNFSMNGINQRTGMTYSFTYTRPSSHWTFGGIYGNYSSQNPNTMQIKEIHKLDTSNQTDFSYFCANQLALSKISAKLDMKKATLMNGAFLNCYNEHGDEAFQTFRGEINTEDKLDKVVSAASAFCNCHTLSALNDSFTFESLVDGSYFLDGTYRLMKLPTNFNPSKLVNAAYMLAAYASDTSYIYIYDADHNMLGKLDTSNRYYCTDEKRYVSYNEMTEHPEWTIIKEFKDDYVKYCKEEEMQVSARYAEDNPGKTYIDWYLSEYFNISRIEDSWKSVDNITNADCMFSGRKHLSAIPMGWNFKSLVTGSSMFNGCSSLTAIPTGWTSTTALNDADGMFYDCSGLTSIPQVFECKNLQNGSNMFHGCTNLTSITDSFSPNNMANANMMFYDCEKLEKMPTGFTSIATITGGAAMMLCGCQSLKEIPSTWTDCHASNINSWLTENDNIEVINTNFDSFINCYPLVYDCGKLTTIGGIVDAGSMYSGFSLYNECPNLVDFKIENLGMTENEDTTAGTYTYYNVIGLFTNARNSAMTEEQMNKLADSFLYFTDHLWTGTTVANSHNHTTRGRSFTHSRLNPPSSASRNKIHIIMSNEEREALKTYIQAKYNDGTHTETTVSLVEGYVLADVQRFNVGDYYLANSIW